MSNRGKIIVAGHLVVGTFAWLAAVALRNAEAADDPSAPQVKVTSAPAASVTAPARLIVMRYGDGRVSHLDAKVRTFEVGADGDFEWLVVQRATKTSLERIVGRIPKDDLASLSAKLAAAGSGPGAEDAGHVEFEFLDDKGKVQTKSYSMPHAAPCEGLLSSINALVAKYGMKPSVETRPSATGPAATQAAGPSDEEIDKLVLAAIKAGPPAAGGRMVKPLDPPKVTAPASNNPHLGGTAALANPFKKHHFRCVLMGYGTAAPWRMYACVSADGNVILPFAADKDFAKALAAEDTSKWTDDAWLDAAKLYVHLSTAANEDGWMLLNKPEDFTAIAFNMPKAGTPQDDKRKADAQKITKPSITREKDAVTVRFFVWRLIGGNLQEWTVVLGKDLKATVKDIARWGGGGYD
ncbi:MAG: hypothetical protein ACE15C_08975 [Phycisphaerae bacterium]